MKKETPNQFVHWLLSQYDDPTKRQELSHTEIYGRLQNVEVGETILASAIGTHEMYTSYIQAGFTQAEALKMILNAQAAVISAASAQQAHKKENDGGN